MIEKCTSFKTADGAIHSTVEEAKTHALTKLIEPDFENALNLAKLIMDNSDQIMNILTMKASSHPKARKVNGGTRKPKYKVELKPEPPPGCAPLN